MALVWKDPPERKTVFNERVTEELRANSGRWALIKTYSGHQCKTPKKPADVEVRWHYDWDEGGHKVSELYARAIA